MPDLITDLMRAARRQGQSGPRPPSVPRPDLAYARAALQAARGNFTATGEPKPPTKAEHQAAAYRAALNRDRFTPVDAAQGFPSSPPPDSIAGGAPIRNLPELLAQE